MAIIRFVGFVPAPGLQSKLNRKISKKQKIVDNDVLKLCQPLIPVKSGNLMRSGRITKDGEIVYTAKYARAQYYSKKSRSYDGRRGGFWFERAKQMYRGQILKDAEKG